MSQDADPQWTLVSWEAVANGPFALVAAAIQPAGIPLDRSLQAGPDLLVVIVSTAALDGLADVEVSLDEAVSSTETIAVLLAEPTGDGLAPALRDLLSVGELIAVPYGIAELLPADFARRGHLEQVADPNRHAVFDVFQRLDDPSATFIADAPTALGEEPDNLLRREDWFRRRQ